MLLVQDSVAPIMNLARDCWRPFGAATAPRLAAAGRFRSLSQWSSHRELGRGGSMGAHAREDDVCGAGASARERRGEDALSLALGLAKPLLGFVVAGRGFS